MTTKKSAVVAKKVDSITKSVKKALPKSATPKTAPKKAASKKTTPKKVSPKTTVDHTFDDAVTQEALKLVDKASSLLRSGIKTSRKATIETRAAIHKDAHSLLGEATRHLDDALKAGNSFLKKAIDKI